jgi:predicted component of type VI protein secretion system
VTVYINREPVIRHDIDTDETLIGRKDPVADAYPDLDLTDYDPEAFVSRKHAYIYRQNKNYTLYAVSNAGTQLNNELLDLGDRRALSDDDVIILAGKIAMKFELPNE